MIHLFLTDERWFSDQIDRWSIIGLIDFKELSREQMYSINQQLHELSYGCHISWIKCFLCQHSTE